MGNGDKTLNSAQAGDAATGQASPADSAQDRRDALRKIGRYSAYTAPVMMAMLLSNKAAAAS